MGQSATSSYFEPDQCRDVPAWSGELHTIGADIGLMMIDMSDCRMHKFPPGWSPLMDEFYLSELDVEVWLLGHHD